MSETNEVSEDNTSLAVSSSANESLLDTENKNSKSLSCVNCNCLLLRPNIALMVKMEKELPIILRSKEDTSRTEVLSDFWCVTDMFQFENMAFSKNVQDVKYLACAECDIGPIGWHNLSDQKSYIAVNRVSHQ